MLLPGVLYFLLAFISHAVISIVLVVLALGTMHIQKPIFADYLNRHIESQNRVTVLSLINVISGIYVALMGLIIGLIADISLAGAFVFMGGLISLSAGFIRIEESDVTTD